MCAVSSVPRFVTRSRVRVLAGFVVLGLIACGQSFAGKPSGGGVSPAPGTIYFINTGGLWSMNGNGTNQQALAAVSSTAAPSSVIHGGSRWYLENRYGDGITGDWGQWFAFTESGATVQLTDDPDLRTNGYPATWAKDDSFFSYCGIYETADEWVGRLFVVAVDWSGGVPVAGPPTVVLEERRPLFDEWGNYSIEGADEVNIGRHDWSPDGGSIALSRWVWGEGWVIDVVTSDELGMVTRRLATRAQNPAWSPDGTRIAYNRDQPASGYRQLCEVWTVAADGTGATALTQYLSSKSSETQQRLPTWSPDGAYIAFMQTVVKSNGSTSSILRIPSSGGSAVTLAQGTVPCWRP